MASTLFSILGCHKAPMPFVWSQSHLESHHLHCDIHHQVQAHPMHAVLHNSFRSVTNQKAYSFWKSMLLVDKFHGHLTWPNKAAIGQFEFSHARWSKHVRQCAQCCHLSWWSATPWFITNVHTPSLEFITPKSNMFLYITFSPVYRCKLWMSFICFSSFYACKIWITEQTPTQDHVPSTAILVHMPDASNDQPHCFLAIFRGTINVAQWCWIKHQLENNFGTLL